MDQKKKKRKLNLNLDPSNLEPIYLGSDYEIVGLIGKGVYGHVYEAIHKITRKIVAIKKIDKIFSNLNEARRLLREIAILKHLNHPSIIKI